MGGDLVVRSRSLWDHVLPLPPDALQPGVMHSHDMPGPQGATLLVREQLVIYTAPSGTRAMRIAVALDRQDIALARDQFAGDMRPALILLALVLMAAAWAQVSIGLRPLEAVRRGVNAIREHRRRRLEGGFPDEVMPLVAEVNELLEAQESAIERARTRAGDLAHGLRTPLTVLSGDARKLRERGEEEIAAEIEELALSMQRHIDRELARTRTAQQAAQGKLSAELGPVVDRLITALRRTPRGEALAWSLDIPEGLVVTAEAADLAEIAGILIDNAVKWATASVHVTACRDDEVVTLAVRDDGKGVPDEMLAALGRRGARLDEQIPGTGLGLAIAREILEAYGGELELANDPEGGIRATARLPTAG